MKIREKIMAKMSIKSNEIKKGKYEQQKTSVNSKTLVCFGKFVPKNLIPKYILFVLENMF